MAGGHLLGSVASDTRPPTTVVVGWARRALEDVVLPALAGRDARLSLLVVRAGEDLSRERPLRGVVWDRVPVDEPLEAVTVSCWDDAAGDPAAAQVARVHAGFPRPRRLPGGGTGEAETTVAFSVARAALAGGRVERPVQDRAVAWVQGAFVELDAIGGYLALDEVTAEPSTMSPYEKAARRPPALRDLRRHVWSPAWGTALTGEHVAALGGDAELGRAPVAHRVPLAGGRWWLQVSDDVEDVGPAGMDALQAYLAPLLPDHGEAT